MCVDSLFLNQFLMGTPFGDAVVRDDQNLIRSVDGGQPVGDGDGGAVFGEHIQALLNPALAFVVQCAGGFIQNQDGRILQEYAGDGNALLLAAGEPGSPFSHKGVIAVGKGLDEVVYVGFFGGVDDFFHGSAGLAVGDVFPDSAAEQVDILLNDADLTA